MAVGTLGDPTEIGISINESGNLSDWFSPDYYLGNIVIFDNVTVVDVSPPYDTYVINGELEITSDITRVVSGGSNSYTFTVLNNGDVPVGLTLAYSQSPSGSKPPSDARNAYVAAAKVGSSVINC